MAGSAKKNQQVSVTQAELDELLAMMRHGCDAIRVVEPSSFDARNFDPETGSLSHSYRCYSALEKGRRCDNCISARTLSTKSANSKFEFVGPDAYLITSRYFDVDGQPRSVEMISKVTDTLGFPGGFESLASGVASATSRAVRDSVTEAYNRAYYDSGIAVLSGDKLVLIHIKNLKDVRSKQGAHIANRLMRAVASAIRRCVRHVDTIIRYEDDMMFLQFDNLPSKVFSLRVQAVYDAVSSVRLQSYPDVIPAVRMGAVEREGIVSELVAQALRALAQATENKPLVYDVDPEVCDHESMRLAAPEERLSYSMFYPESDELTGVMSQQRFMQALREAVNAKAGGCCHASDTALTIVNFDVEDFKSFNREYGFQEGDVLLRFIAEVIGRAFPDSPLTRLAVDRFVLLATPDELDQRIDNLHQRLRHYRTGVSVELKAGVCELDETVRDANILLDRAKIACDSIKGWYDCHERRYDDDFDREISMGQYVISHLDEAIEQGYAEVYYQPIVRAASGAVCEYEALSRWNDPTFGLLSPLTFIGTLERSHLINKLDAHVLRQVCLRLRSQLDAGLAVVPVSVNLSPLDFTLTDVIELVESTCARYKIPHNLISIEVTESALSSDAGSVKKDITLLRTMGFEVWMDDFGSGYSSLNLLKDYGFDVLKVDMAFLAGFEHNERAREILVCVIDMAKRLGSRTLVEGVETEEEYVFLRDVGCEMLQGYLFSRPQPWNAIVAMDLVEEPLSERAYFEAVGQVNLAGTVIGQPVEEKDVSPAFRPDSLPLAVLECRGGQLHYLLANNTYLAVVGEHLPGLLTGTLLDSLHGTVVSDTPLLSLVRKELESGEDFHEEQELMLSIDDGHDTRISVRVQRIAQATLAEAYVVTLEARV